jgi:hypothetical protein
MVRHTETALVSRVTWQKDPRAGLHQLTCDADRQSREFQGRHCALRNLCGAPKSGPVSCMSSKHCERSGIVQSLKKHATVCSSSPSMHRPQVEGKRVGHWQ